MTNREKAIAIFRAVSRTTRPLVWEDEWQPIEAELNEVERRGRIEELKNVEGALDRLGLDPGHAGRIYIRARLARLRAEQEGKSEDEPAPYVCPGCYAVGGEKCAPGCIDAEIEEERQRAIERGDYDRINEDEDEQC